MPVYAYRCSSCDYGFDGMNSVENRHNVQCPKCGQACRIEIAQVSVICWPSYQHHTLGQVTGPRQRERRIKEMGLEEHDELPSQMKLPSTGNHVLNTPEAEKEFLKIYEERAHA